jgi:hypothetical protein
MRFGKFGPWILPYINREYDLPLSELYCRCHRNRKGELVSNDMLGAMRGFLPHPLEKIGPRTRIPQ